MRFRRQLPFAWPMAAALLTINSMDPGSAQAHGPLHEQIVRRGEILQMAGRHAEAKQAFASALKAIESLPAPRRYRKAMVDLEKRIHAAL